MFDFIHPFRFFEEVEYGEVPKTDAIPYSSTCSVDGAEVGPVPYWSGIAQGMGKHKSVDFANARLKYFTVERENTYRFRLIGAQSLYAYRFSIDDHNLTLIATDGYFIEPVEIDYIIIHTGERYDFLLEANEITNNYLIRFETLEVNCIDLDRDNDLVDNDGIAVLNYEDIQIDYTKLKNDYSNKNPKGCSGSRTCMVANCPFENYTNDGYECVNVDNFKLLTPTTEDELPDSDLITKDSTLFFNFGFDSNEFTSTINGRNFILPSTSLFNIDENDLNKPQFCTNSEDECSGSQCQCTHIAQIDEKFYNKLFRFVLSSLNITSGFSFAHPVHLHGHSFHVVKIGYPNYTSDGRLDIPNPDLECDNPCERAPTWRNERDISINNKTI